MKTVGQILKKTRLEKKISLEEVAVQTKIRQNILEALEEDDFQKLSSVASVKGFLKTYAEFLGLPSEGVLAIFRRDFGKKEKKKVIPQGMVKPLSKKRFNWGPKTTLIFLIVFVFLGLASYLGYQYFSLVRPPFLKVISPTQGAHLEGEIVEVVGRADPDATVRINGEPVLLSSKGEFKYQLRLFPGENNLLIEAESKLGKKTEVQRTVVFGPKEPQRY